MKTVLCCLLALTSVSLNASKRDSQDDSLAKYVARVQMAQPAAPALSLGSVWVDSGRMASLSADYKAMIAGDLITIVVVQDVTSSNAGAVSTGRTFSASSGVDSLPGKLKVGGAANLLGLHSAETLSGKGQASSTTSVTTTLAGRVVAVLASGNLVIEAGGRAQGRYWTEQHGRFEHDRRSGTGNQGQRRDLGRGAAAASGAARHPAHSEFLGALF